MIVYDSSPIVEVAAAAADDGHGFDVSVEVREPLVCACGKSFHGEWHRVAVLQRSRTLRLWLRHVVKAVPGWKDATAWMD